MEVVTDLKPYLKKQPKQSWHSFEYKSCKFKMYGYWVQIMQKGSIRESGVMGHSSMAKVITEIESFAGV